MPNTDYTPLVQAIVVLFIIGIFYSLGRSQGIEEGRKIERAIKQHTRRKPATPKHAPVPWVLVEAVTVLKEQEFK